MAGRMGRPLIYGTKMLNSDSAIVRLTAEQRQQAEAAAKKAGMNLSEFLRAVIVLNAETKFASDFLKASFAVEGRPGTTPSKGQQSPDEQRQAALAMWIRSQPLSWTTPAGLIRADELKSRCQLFEDLADEAAKDSLTDKELSVEDMVLDCGHWDRERFATAWLGFTKPTKRVEASSHFEAAKKGPPPRGSRSRPAGPLRRV